MQGIKASESALGNELRIVLLGKTGAGKSSAGNTILGREAFKEICSLQSCTQICERQEGTVQGRSITVIDTPGIFDTQKNENEIKSETEKCIYQSAPGPHVFLLVISLRSRFTEEERKAVEWVQKNFGEAASPYIMVLFTAGDDVGGKAVEEIIKSSEMVSELIRKCGDRYCVFNNKERDDPTQVTELLRKIEEMVEKNGGQHYTNEMYMKAQQKLLTVTEWLMGLGMRLLQNVKDKETAALKKALEMTNNILISVTAAMPNELKEVILKKVLTAVRTFKGEATGVQYAVVVVLEVLLEMGVQSLEKSKPEDEKSMIEQREKMLKGELMGLTKMGVDLEAALNSVTQDVIKLSMV